MSIKIYNSLTRKKDEFIPLVSGKVKMYTCGVTVYDDCHIGHARSLFIFEVIRRYLRYKGYEVKFIRNITDIDDKIINRANDLGMNSGDLARKYTLEYYKDLELLDIDKADIEPKATEHINDMIKAIEGLINKGYAYRVDSDVYFSVDKFRNYGRLSHQNKEHIKSGMRIEEDRRKENSLDFALWKSAKPNEPKWSSPWGEGRPGWHIECSVMSTKYLGSTFDIHGGGIDLIFPHHENEIAQAEGLSNKTFACYWMHHGLLSINGQKMAKSLGNSLTIKQALSKYHPDTLKLFFLSSHYRSPIDFTDEKMLDWDKAKKKIDIFHDRANACASSKSGDLKDRLTPMAKYARQNIKKARENFEEAMDDDFNTPGALAVLFDFLDKTSEFMNFNEEDRNLAFYFSNFLVNELCCCLGISVKLRESKVSDKDITAKIEERNKARAKGDFKKADRIREELETEGIILEDTRDGHTIHRRK